MENASKALIIAGAILISIMIIGLGVVILNNVSDVIKGANVDTEAAQANNEKFVSSFGENLSASEVKSLINTIRANNITATNDNGGLGEIFILLKAKTDANSKNVTATAASKAIQNGRRYQVNTPNDKSISEKKFLASNAWSDTEGQDGNAAYYYNGYIRAIEIIEVT